MTSKSDATPAARSEAMAGAADGMGSKYAALDPTDGPELDAAMVSRRRPSASERRSKERFVYGCAIFASLNAILLGYGQSSSLLSFLHLCFLPHLNSHSPSQILPNALSV